METHPADLSIAEAGAALRERRLTSLALVEAHLGRIDERDARIRAFVALAAGPARRAAARADAELAAGTDRGPLHGIPFAVKDVIDVAGLPTRCGSHRTADVAAVADAAVVARLRAAGAVPLGKLATYEYALDGPSFDAPHPPPRNPWNLAHVTGGSSSGSAAAVAAGLVRFALGTDTGGSVRSPACYCGVVGLKPTFDALPMQGVQALSPSLDHVGLIAATADEAALVFEALMAVRTDSRTDDPATPSRMPPERRSSASSGSPGLRIGYARDWFVHDPALRPEVLSAIDDAASALSLGGARVVPVTLPDYAPIETAGAAILSIEAFEVHRDAIERARAGAARADAARDDEIGDEEVARSTAGFGRQAWAGLLRGEQVPRESVDAGRAVGASLRRALNALFAEHDVLLTACALGPAPPFADFDGRRATWTPMRTLPLNLAGHPALSCPAGLVDGLPVGVQIVGPVGGEAGVCAAAAALERSLAPLGAPPGALAARR